MTLTRRSFLGGALTITVVALTPAVMAKLVPYAPAIVGDGIHDDTDGLEALFNGMPFTVEGERVVAVSDQKVLLNGGTFRTTRTVNIRRSSPLVVDGGDCSIVCEAIEGPILHFHDVGMSDFNV